ncbi:MAG: protein phosphatase 2C domain-containing protein [bacterium]|nr:protein phosphatase 2C domain-containing protein [bacterium]
MITYIIYTNQGKRDYNEDCANVIETGSGICLVLADGLGGHGKGEVASNIAVSNSLRQFELHGMTDLFMEEAFQKSQKQILEAQKELGSDSQAKTTLVVAAVSDQIIMLGHMGDSRGYMFDTSNGYRRTIDHSVPQMLVQCGEIEEKEIRNHPDRNRLLKALGMSSEEKVKWELDYKGEIMETRAILLCSDGFWEYIDEAHMMKYLKRAHSVEDWMNKMLHHIRLKGIRQNMDNYTAVALWITPKEKMKNGNCKL